MRKFWIPFYVDNYQAYYFYDTKHQKVFKCHDNYHVPTGWVYGLLFMCVLLSDVLNRLFMPLENRMLNYLFVAAALFIGIIVAYIILKQIYKYIDETSVEIDISADELNEYISRGRLKFKKDVIIIGAVVGLSTLFLILSIGWFVAMNNTYILVVTIFLWLIVLICILTMQPVKRYRFLFRD